MFTPKVQIFSVRMIALPNPELVTIVASNNRSKPIVAVTVRSFILHPVEAGPIHVYSLSLCNLVLWMEPD